MEKKVYIFKCTDTVDLGKVLTLYNKVCSLIKLDCDKYGLVFKKSNEKLWSRRGTTKNIEQNIKKYLLLNEYPQSNLCSMAIYDVPEGAQWWDHIKRTNGFYIESYSNEGMFYIYIVLPYSLDNDHMLQLWNTISSQYCTDYMVHFKMDSERNVEISMQGIPVLEGVKTIEQCYLPDEIKIVHKLHDLRVFGSCELGDVFPLCIATKKCFIDDKSYVFKVHIESNTYLYSK
jgi:hypothetical protein